VHALSESEGVPFRRSDELIVAAHDSEMTALESATGQAQAVVFDVKRSLM
jgi:hypothetical protein